MDIHANAALAKYLEMVNSSFADIHRRLAILEHLVSQNPSLATEYEAAKRAKLPTTPSGLPMQLQGVVRSMNSR